LRLSEDHDCHDDVRGNGANEVITLEEGHEDEQLGEKIMSATKGHGVDIATELLGGSMYQTGIRSLAPNGRMVITGFASGDIPVVRTYCPLLGNIELSG
jgi:NADPH2:quinone reductase